MFLGLCTSACRKQGCREKQRQVRRIPLEASKIGAALMQQFKNLRKLCNYRVWEHGI
jgi:hypothetical protein